MMLGLHKFIIGVFASSVISASSLAALPNGPTVGIKLGQVFVDNDVVDDSIFGYSIFAGYRFQAPNLFNESPFGIEIEYLSSKDKRFNTEESDFKYSVNSIGAYGTYQYDIPNSETFIKGKLGLASNAKKLKNNIGGEEVSFSTGRKIRPAAGIALGLNLEDNFAIQAEYNLLESNAQAITIGANYKFK